MSNGTRGNSKLFNGLMGLRSPALSWHCAIATLVVRVSVLVCVLTGSLGNSLIKGQHIGSYNQATKSEVPDHIKWTVNCSKSLREAAHSFVLEAGLLLCSVAHCRLFKGLTVNYETCRKAMETQGLASSNNRNLPKATETITQKTVNRTYRTCFFSFGQCTELQFWQITDFLTMENDPSEENDAGYFVYVNAVFLKR